MHSYFVPQRGDARHVLAAYSCVTRKDPLNTTLTELVLKSNLLPNPAEVAAAISGKECISPCSQFSLHPAVGSVESLDIPTLSLNASKLANLGAVRILWTHNLSRHMILSNHAKMYYLELFALPSALQGGPDAVLHSAGISSDLMDEICQSYANLFNPIKTPVWHRRLLKYVAGDFWCWCLYCSSQRLRRSQLKYLKSMHRAPKMSRHLNTTRIVFDISLQELMDHRATGWDQTEFRNLWPRIQALDAHLAASKPWNFWVIFRDRRDSVQFWTFL
jgi:hypothetical protein